MSLFETNKKFIKDEAEKAQKTLEKCGFDTPEKLRRRHMELFTYVGDVKLNIILHRDSWTSIDVVLECPHCGEAVEINTSNPEETGILMNTEHTCPAARYRYDSDSRCECTFGWDIELGKTTHIFKCLKYKEEHND
jgi:hypothetical protein